jgi:predicted double-glycine peptidase
LHVVKQQEDYSCGAAALATLLSYYFGDATSEKETLELLLNPLSDAEKIVKSRRGFSLLDLKRVAEMKGYRAGGFKVTFSQLTQVKTPVIVFLEPHGYKHFAVYRGFDRGRVYLADPARGNLRMTIGRFLDEWREIIFVLGKEAEETIQDYPLMVPKPEYVQPELARFNGMIDIGFIMHSLPQR